MSSSSQKSKKPEETVLENWEDLQEEEVSTTSRRVIDMHQFRSRSNLGDPISADEQNETSQEQHHHDPD